MEATPIILKLKAPLEQIHFYEVRDLIRIVSINRVTGEITVEFRS